MSALTPTRVAIVDYGLGNVQAIANIYKRLDIDAVLAREPADLERASHLVLPGVGAFDWAMARLEASGLRAPLEEQVLRRGKPVLGICVGMQMLAKSSDEGRLPGLGWIDAVVHLFDHASFSGRTHLPHMGWNDVEPVRAEGLFAGLGAKARFYFLHSYVVAPRDAADRAASTVYGAPFACAVQRGHIHGVQFHPEKSHGFGIQLLKNFAGLPAAA